MDVSHIPYTSLNAKDELLTDWAAAQKQNGTAREDLIPQAEQLTQNKALIDIFLKAAQELHIEPSRSLVIEDAVAGVEAAHAAGMRCIAVAGNRDLPGLRKAELMVKTLLEVDVKRVQTLS